MYNSVIECVKVSNIFDWVKKKTCLGLFERCDSIRRHSKSNQLIKITMTITTVLHYAMLAPSLCITYHLCARVAIIAFSVEKSSCGNPRRRHFRVVTSSLRLAIKVEPENVSMGTLFVTQEFNHIFVNEVLN